MGTTEDCNYGLRDINVYPVRESELNGMRTWAWFSLLGIGIPFLIIDVISTVNRIKRETKFDEKSSG